MQDIEGKTAVVTGAGGGIGRAIALSLAAEGANVVVCDIEEEFALAVADEVAATGVGALGVGADVAKLAEVENLADRAYGKFGSVEILANNAGVTMRPYRASWDTSYEDFLWMVGVNWWGVLHGHHVFVPRMLQTPGEKHIVNTSSMATLGDTPGHSAYAAAKSAVNGFTTTAAAELATQGIGVTLFMPGRVNTRIPTSERLRPESERSSSRVVKPWTDYVAAKQDPDPRFDGLPVLGQTGRATESVFREPLDPDVVGPMVVRAIKENRSYCITHAAPVAGLEARTAEIVAGYDGST